MLSFRTQGYSGHSVKYSPFFDNKLAVAAAANYGLVGNGRIYILDVGPDGVIRPEKEFETQDGAFSLTWSETHEHHVATAHGDGTVKVFDITKDQFPLMSLAEHSREVFSVNWNLADKSLFCSASWDETIKVWSMGRPNSILTLHAPTLGGPVKKIDTPVTTNSRGNDGANCVYSAKFSPHDPAVVASVHSDSSIRIWDTRMNPKQPVTVFPQAHFGLEILALDWNKYRASTLATGGVDKAVKVWDIRQPNSGGVAAPPRGPVNDLRGHDYAIRSVAWSPHAAEVLLSTSYDTTVRIWKDDSGESSPYNPRVNHTKGLLSVFDKHSEFVIDADWSLWGQPGWVVSTGWDEMVHLWKAV